MQLVELVWEKHEDGFLELTCEREKPIKHLYGVRFEHLRPPVTTTPTYSTLKNNA